MNRPDWKAEKKLNKETFGVAGGGYGGWRRGYGYRGGNRGYRGGGGRGGGGGYGGGYNRGGECFCDRCCYHALPFDCCPFCHCHGRKTSL